MAYKVGQVIEGIYTIECAEWCNSNSYYLEEIEPLEDGTRRFEIKENLPPEPHIETEEEKAIRIANLKLTGTDVKRAIYKAIGLGPEDIINFVIEKQPEGLDIKALKIELEANHFYRGNPYVDAIGNLLGFSKEQLDNFFLTNNWEELLPKTEN